MGVPEKVVLHPLVLLSVVDHYNRTARDTKKRVVGLLLGDTHKGQVDVTNSFAIPFEEDDQDPTIWFLDHSYLENMFHMFKKVNAREKVVGWYSTGPRLREADVDINQLVANYCESPVLVICEVEPKEVGLPFTAYCSVNEVREDGTEKARKVFVSVPTEVGQTEAEEIGVEHLLRNVKDATISTLATDVAAKLQALRGLKGKLGEVQEYLGAVAGGRLPLNHDINGYLQDMFNLLPNMSAEHLSSALAVKSNDMMAVVSVLAMHKLIDNKEGRMWRERAKTDKAAAEREKKEGDAKDKEGSGKDAAAEGEGGGGGGKDAAPASNGNPAKK
ncbi:MAG: 26S proteasome regulatory subunit [Monoraphidium minutum]|nr:MAG: 26S proteasome regulatory subunit [Monoraphidium minutum]